MSYNKSKITFKLEDTSLYPQFERGIFFVETNLKEMYPKFYLFKLGKWKFGMWNVLSN